MTIDPNAILAFCAMVTLLGAFVVWMLNYQNRTNSKLEAKLGRAEHDRICTDRERMLVAISTKIDANERHALRYRDRVEAELRENAIDLALIQRELNMPRRRRAAATALLSGEDGGDGSPIG